LELWTYTSELVAFSCRPHAKTQLAIIFAFLLPTHLAYKQHLQAKRW